MTEDLHPAPLSEAGLNTVLKDYPAASSAKGISIEQVNAPLGQLYFHAAPMELPNIHRGPGPQPLKGKGLRITARMNWYNVIPAQDLNAYTTIWRVWCSSPSPQWVNLNGQWQQGDGDFSPYQHLTTGFNGGNPQSDTTVWVSPRKPGEVYFVLEIYHQMGNWWRDARFPLKATNGAVQVHQPAHSPQRQLALLPCKIPV